MLVYSVHMDNTINERTTAYDGRWEFTILRKNADGSVRVMGLKALSQTSTANGQSRSAPEVFTRGYFDMMPDGRMKMNPTFVPGFNPLIVLPRLPASADEIAKGWGDFFPPSYVTTRFTMKEPDGQQLVFLGEETGPYHRIQERTDKWTYHFDPARGLITQVDGDNGQTYGSEQKGTAQIVLDKEEQIAEADLKPLGDEHDAFVKAFEQADDLARRAVAGLGNPQEELQKAQDVLNEANGAATLEPVKADYADALAKLQSLANRQKYDAQRIEPLLNQPAPDFSLTDWQGNAHKLADLRGKVVVLDFFRRNANQSAFTVPQVAKLAGEYKDKPVAFFGMNNDTDDDLKMIVESSGIPYPVLKLEGQPTDFGLTAVFGTVIIDQKGNIRAVMQGYSKSRGQDVKEHIDELLKNPEK
jgi:peroxiredoxin